MTLTPPHLNGEEKMCESDSAKTGEENIDLAPLFVAVPYSSVKGTFDVSLPTGQFSLSTTVFCGLR